jgi:hypothetical protein
MPNDLPSNSLDPLILDLLEWIARAPRSHADLLDAWRTSCPRLTVWEDCTERGFATRVHMPGQGASVQVTDTGLAFLQAHRGPIRQTSPAPNALRIAT